MSLLPQTNQPHVGILFQCKLMGVVGMCCSSGSSGSMVMEIVGSGGPYEKKIHVSSLGAQITQACIGFIAILITMSTNTTSTPRWRNVASLGQLNFSTEGNIVEEHLC